MRFLYSLGHHIGSAYKQMLAVVTKVPDGPIVIEGAIQSPEYSYSTSSDLDRFEKKKKHPN